MIPGQGAKIPHVLWPKNQNIKQKQYWEKFNKDFKMDHILKILKQKGHSPSFLFFGEERREGIEVGSAGFESQAVNPVC